MTIQYSLMEIEQDLDELLLSINAVDMESVKEKTLRRVAERMSEMVRQAVFESSIRSPASKVSPYDSGDGPPLATKAAWVVNKDGERYTVSPHPEVRQRAIVLNFGYPGKITPNQAEYLRFEVNGLPVFRKEVDGPDATGYWRKAFNRMEMSGEIERIAGEELHEEFEEKFS